MLEHFLMCYLKSFDETKKERFSLIHPCTYSSQMTKQLWKLHQSHTFLSKNPPYLPLALERNIWERFASSVREVSEFCLYSFCTRPFFLFQLSRRSHIYHWLRGLCVPDYLESLIRCFNVHLSWWRLTIVRVNPIYISIFKPTNSPQKLFYSKFLMSMLTGFSLTATADKCWLLK